jgi:pimeloyl-ACP methyl ester carboxylesterase
MSAPSAASRTVPTLFGAGTYDPLLPLKMLEFSYFGLWM